MIFGDAVCLKKNGEAKSTCIPFNSYSLKYDAYIKSICYDKTEAPIEDKKAEFKVSNKASKKTIHIDVQQENIIKT